ncbi:MAG TPA: hypothetical protein VK760_06800 [Candidatus Acidoferrales bacterium]|jgi:hypothetical protein|nr:hypothetical protein [Candidatus Acidoferrales bacterium]
MQIRFLRSILTLGFLGATAACAALQSGGTIGARSGDIPQTRAHAAASPVGYLYAVNYNSNTVSQLAFVPGSKPPIVSLGDFSLPSGCTGPDGIQVLPAQNLAFISCYSGEVLPLNLGKNHELEASTVAPIPIPSPLQVLVPATGAKGVLYVDAYPGSVALLSYGAKRLKLLHSYPTGSVYPAAMSLYTNPHGNSTLFVAAAYAGVACGSITGGAILRWSQNSKGNLTPEATIPACTTAYDLVALNGKVFWASASFFGGFDLVHNKPLKLKTPFAPYQGPGYYPAAMQPLGVVKQAPTSMEPSDAVPGSDFTLDGVTGSVFFMRNGVSIGAVDIAKRVASLTDCKAFFPKIKLNGIEYGEICFSIVGDTLVVQGLQRNFKTGEVAKTSLGSLPIAEVFAGAGEFR